MITSEFETLFKKHFRSCVFIAEMMVNSREVAEDIVQNVFIKMLDKDLRKINSPTNFLYTSVRNAAIDHCRTQTYARESLETANIPDNTNYDLDSSELEHANNVKRLFNAIEKLPEQSRKVVKLICLESYSYKDAARKLGMSVATVKTHMYRSFKSLKKTVRLENPNIS